MAYSFPEQPFSSSPFSYQCFDGSGLLRRMGVGASQAISSRQAFILNGEARNTVVNLYQLQRISPLSRLITPKLLWRMQSSLDRHNNRLHNGSNVDYLCCHGSNYLTIRLQSRQSGNTRRRNRGPDGRAWTARGRSH
jgi:hypothetical protein